MGIAYAPEGAGYVWTIFSRKFPVRISKGLSIFLRLAIFYCNINGPAGG